MSIIKVSCSIKPVQEDYAEMTGKSEEEILDTVNKHKKLEKVYSKLRVGCTIGEWFVVVIGESVLSEEEALQQSKEIDSVDASTTNLVCDDLVVEENKGIVGGSFGTYMSKIGQTKSNVLLNMSEHQIIIFANSVKHQQHCVAGKTLDGKWIRPVSNKSGGELKHEQAKCRNPHGLFNVKPLQKVTIGLAGHFPLINQPENYLIDDSEWRQNYRIDESQINNYLDNPNDLWGEGDRVDFSLIKRGAIQIKQSLYLVQVHNLRVFTNKYEKPRASFVYKNTSYELAVTDPLYDCTSEHKGILCISLGEPYNGSCYKLVATIL